MTKEEFTEALLAIVGKFETSLAFAAPELHQLHRDRMKTDIEDLVEEYSAEAE